MNWQRHLQDVTAVRLKVAVARLRAAADLAQRRSAGHDAIRTNQQALAFADALVPRTGELADRCQVADLARARPRLHDLGQSTGAGVS